MEVSQELAHEVSSS